MKDSDSFQESSWGYPFRTFESLAVLELEVETLEEQREKLDLVLTKADGWRFPLAKRKELVFNPQKTRWEGWHGPNLGEFYPSTIALFCVVFILGLKGAS